MKLTTKIFVALILGVVVGIVLQDHENIADFFGIIGTIYIKLIKMIMIPLVITSLIVGITNVSELKKVGQIGLYSFLIFIITTGFAVIIGLFISNLLKPGNSFSMEVNKTTDNVEIPSFVDTIMNIVPENPFVSLYEANMLPIIFFALMIGFGIVKARTKGEVLRSFFVSSYEVVNVITGFVMKFTPIGVFGLIVPVVSKNGLEILIPLSNVLISFYLAVILMLIVYCIMLKLLSGFSLGKFFEAILPAQLVAFSTCSSAATLPIMLKRVQDNLKISKEVSGFVLPLGATINMDGNAIYQGIAALFIAQAYGIELNLTMQFMIVLTGIIASIGAAGVPGAGMIVLSVVLLSVGLPVEGVAIVAGVDRIIDMGRTLINVTGDATTTVIIDKAIKKKHL
ncbi:dicarboxylate/amino acid:cation symporter [Salirhabdus sp. Marseille-P4669]|uniref:dicarboxylate/amino acid:cation symporter n=1 Tax=Salirhabdus sp. Marseille-P4669 TaxID=2042310 RepID=UPI000C7C9A62|nr:dicarboxylate/amino acid:cation symporter [Salirhabdus sp. Marseille-P4669]